MVWPDPLLHPTPALTMRLTGAQADGRSLHFQPGDVAALDTAYNCFAVAKWQRDCGLRDLALVVQGQGQFVVTITDGPRETRFAVTNDTTIDLTPLLATTQAPLFYVTLRAVTPGQITALNWCSHHHPLRAPNLLLCITTFHREAQATATIARFGDFMAHNPLQPHLHLVVIDNGHSLTVPPSPHVTVLPNRNLGGSGGFARGLAHAVDHGHSHILFMDDDAAIDMATLARCWTYLAHATHLETAVAGALMQADQPTHLWENGAIFDGLCRPLSQGRDLTNPQDLTQVETTSLAPHPNLYGGFWFFAFAVAQVRHWPFPFFVRGDDVSFCLSNPFRITTLPGVISYQDQDFPDKETSLTLYLGLRCDLINLLTAPVIAKRAIKTLAVPALTFWRCMVLLRSDSMAALNLAVEDVLSGPDFFARNADLAQRRTQIAAARRAEVWQPLATPTPRQHLRLNPQARWLRAVMLITLNGLALPFFGRWGNQIVVPQGTRLRVSQAWGAARITVLATDGSRAMVLHHAKGAALRQGLRLAGNLLRLMWRYRNLRQVWATGYCDLTTRAFWDAQSSPGPLGIN